MSATTRPWLRQFRGVRVSVWLWGLAVAAVVAGSLVPPPSGLPAVEGGDKLVHLAGYGGLMAGAVVVFARSRSWFLIAACLIGLGIALEVAQGALTETRMADPADALANALGVVIGAGLALTPLPRWLERRFPS